MSPARSLPFLLGLLTGLAGCAPGPPSTAPAGDPLFADPHAVEVLTEAAELGEPVSDRPNRFFRDWRPRTVDGRRGLLASPGGASLQVVTVVPGERTLSFDLLQAPWLARAGHLEVRIDGASPRLVPFADPLTIRLPEDLPPGRHLVELAPRGPDRLVLLVAGSAIRPHGSNDRSAGGAEIVDGDLAQTGPSLVDVVARPGPGRRLAGELCPGDFPAGTAGVSVEVVSAEGRRVAGWSGGGGPVDRLRGCRRIELLPEDRPEPDGPVRVRLAVTHEGREVRWRDWWWLPEEDPEEGSSGGPRGTTDAARSPAPRLVVLYVLDALRADFVGHLGGPEGISPVLDRLAREGATFRRHWATGPNTLAAVPDLFTGEVWVSEGAWRAAGASRPTLAEVYRAAGYRTGLVSGNGYLTRYFGLARGFEHVSEEALFDVSSPGGPAVNRSAERAHRAALGWLDTLPRDEAVFLHVQTIHPHNPYAPPPDLERRFTAGIPSDVPGDTATLKAIQRGQRSTSAADRARLRNLYAASLAYNDRELGRFLEALAERYPARETLLVVTSDHGDELFDHGGVLHGYTLYEELLHVPLVVRWPGTVLPGGPPEGFERPTDHLDLHATLLDAAGALGPPPAPGGQAQSAGRSLLPLLTGRADALSDRLLFAAAPGVAGGIHAVRDGPWKLIRVAGSRDRWVMGTGRGRSWEREYLFDLAADPGERHNLAGKGGVREQWLRARLRAWLAERRAVARDAEPAPETFLEELDEETRRRLRALGYID